MGEGDAEAVLEVSEPIAAPENAISTSIVLESLDATQMLDETPSAGDGDTPTNGDMCSKHPREDTEGMDGESDSKKPKIDESPAEDGMNSEVKAVECSGEGGKEKRGPVSLGPKRFDTSAEMFDYFFKMIHHWTPNINLNKYEHAVLLELLEKGHSEPERKIGGGIRAFQVRNHPMFKSRCFFLIRNDDSVDDFSFRKCVDQLLPLPEGMKPNPAVNKVLGGDGGKGHGRKPGGRGRGGRGHGRGGRGWRGN